MLEAPTWTWRRYHGWFVKVSDSIKMTADAHIALLKYLEPWLKNRITFWRTIMFMQDNAPLHAVHKTSVYIQ